MIKVALLGNFQVSYTTETHIALSLEALGVEVTCIQENATSADEIVARATEAGILLWVRTWELPYMWDVLARCRAARVISIAYHLDLWLPLSRGVGAKDNPFLMGTDHIWTPEGDWANEYNALRKNWHYLPPAVYHAECYRGEVRDEWKGKVVFTGTGAGYHSEYPFRQQLIEFLHTTYGNDFLHIPSGVRGHDLNCLYESADCVVGDFLNLNFASKYYLSDRIYETMGRSGLLVSPRIKILEDQGFVHGKHLRYYEPGNLDDLKVQIEWMRGLAPGNKDWMRHDAIALVRESHTYAHRMAQILATVVAAK